MGLNDIVNVYMQRCIELAHQVSPGIGKPLVGAIVVSEDGRIVGDGLRQFISGTSLVEHAERVALNLADEKARGSYLFTTLEPCVKKSGSKSQILSSCSNLIVERGIKEVIVGLLDDSPSMKPGSGIAYLKSKGIIVHHHTLYQERIVRELMPRQYRLPNL